MIGTAGNPGRARRRPACSPTGSGGRSRPTRSAPRCAPPGSSTSSTPSRTGSGSSTTRRTPSSPRAPDRLVHRQHRPAARLLRARHDAHARRPGALPRPGRRQPVRPQRAGTGACPPTATDRLAHQGRRPHPAAGRGHEPVHAGARAPDASRSTAASTSSTSARDRSARATPCDIDPEVLGFPETFPRFPLTDPGWFHAESDNGPGPARPTPAARCAGRRSAPPTCSRWPPGTAATTRAARPSQQDTTDATRAELKGRVGVCDVSRQRPTGERRHFAGRAAGCCRSAKRRSCERSPTSRGLCCARAKPLPGSLTPPG